MDPITLALLGLGAASGFGGALMGGGEPDVRQVGGPSDERIQQLTQATDAANAERRAMEQARMNRQVVQGAAAGGTLRGGLPNRGFQESADVSRLAGLQQEANSAQLQAGLYGQQQWQAFPTTQQRIGSALGGLGGSLAGAGATGAMLSNLPQYRR